MTQRIRKTLTTGSAMFGLWERRNFENVVNYDSWSEELLEEEDIERHTTAGHFVPITNYSDGVFDFELRIGTDDERCEVNEREQSYVTETSESYLFRSEGELNISGIEFIGATLDSDVGHLDIPAGPYTVTVYQIDWADEPGVTDDEGNPTEAALPDFLIILNPANSE